MRARELTAMGTSWWIACDVPELLDQAVAEVHVVEARLSRFRPDSALSRLNRERVATDAMLATVTRLALQFHALTGGAFDPTLGARLAELGYDRTFAAIERSHEAPTFHGERLRVHVDGDRVELEGPGSLDLGGIAKGWTVDRVADSLRANGARRAVVDGGGDIRAFGQAWPIGFGDGFVIDVSDGAVVTSSTLARRWKSEAGAELHHILDPRTGEPARTSIDTATVAAKDATTADVLATALLVATDSLVPRLRALGARAALRGRDGRWWTTPDWEEKP